MKLKTFSVFIILFLKVSIGHAQVITDSAHSPSLSGNLLDEPGLRQLLIYTPPGYEEEPQRKYPVVYLLHSYNSGPESWLGENGYENMNIATVLDSLILNNLIDPLLVVMPDATTRFGGSWYTNSSTGGNWVNFIAEDLVNFIDSKYNTIPEKKARGITGQSMGAYGALHIAMSRPDVFGSMAAVSPVNVVNPNPFGQPAHELALDIDKDNHESAHILARLLWSKAIAFSPNPKAPTFFADLPIYRENGSIQQDDTVWEQWQNYALINRIDDHKPELNELNILLSAGNADPLIEETKLLSQTLLELNIEHRFEIFDGGHVEGVRRHIENDLFAFFDGHLQKTDAQKHSLWVEKASSLADSIFKAQNLPGLSVAVSVNNELVWSEGFGFADVERQIPAGSETQFRIGSVSKLFTSTAVIRLHQQNRINLHAPIHTYIPGLPESLAQITAYQLAGHLSGIRHYGRDEYINRTTYNDLAETLSIFMNDSLLSAPGEEYSYSSYGYNLLGAVMQAAAKQEFRELMKELLFDPLDMSSTVAEHPESRKKRPAQFYSRDQQGGFQVAMDTDLSDRWPSGGYGSTAEDLVRFGKGVLNKNIIKSESRELLFTNQRTKSGEEIGVGMGWRIGTDNQGRRIVHHGGDSIGGRAFLLVYPDQEISVAMVSNLSFAGFGEKEAMEIANIFLEIIE